MPDASSGREVTTFIHNGLGNQLFQFAAGRALADELGARTTFEWNGATPSLVGLSGFATDLTAGRRVGLPPEPERGRMTLGERVRRRWWHRRHGVMVISQRTAESYRPRPPITPDARTVRLDGQFQHPSWFAPALADTLDRLEAGLVDRRAYSWAQGRTVISFRRNDYSQLGWRLDLAYYRRAIERLEPIHPVSVVSDDKDFGDLALSWLRERGLTVAPASEAEPRTIQRDLALLAGACSVVMSNSTFCWWATVAGDRLARSAGRERTVYAPGSWIPLEDSTVLLRPEWNPLETAPDDARSADGSPA